MQEGQFSLHQQDRAASRGFSSLLNPGPFTLRKTGFTSATTKAPFCMAFVEKDKSRKVMNQAEPLMGGFKAPGAKEGALPSSTLCKDPDEGPQKESKRLPLGQLITTIFPSRSRSLPAVCALCSRGSCGTKCAFPRLPCQSLGFCQVGVRGASSTAGNFQRTGLKGKRQSCASLFWLSGGAVSLLEYVSRGRTLYKI